MQQANPNYIQVAINFKTDIFNCIRYVVLRYYYFYFLLVNIVSNMRTSIKFRQRIKCFGNLNSEECFQSIWHNYTDPLCGEEWFAELNVGRTNEIKAMIHLCTQKGYIIIRYTYHYLGRRLICILGSAHRLFIIYKHNTLQFY